MNKPELITDVLPCPFCGKKPMFELRNLTFNKLGTPSYSTERWVFRCCVYMTTFTTPLEEKSRETALKLLKKRWNTRSYNIE